MGEAQTLELAARGMPIARYGDGELKLALGRNAKSQRFVPELGARLIEILKAPPGPCLVCIPNVESKTPKAGFWLEYGADHYARLYARQAYGSSFVTRPDSAPWIDTPEYWDQLSSLWRGKHVVLVRGSSKSFTQADLTNAKSVEQIVASRQHAWVDYPWLMEKLKREHKRNVLICLGATATVLAFDLAALGVKAFDLGHAGMFMRREGRFDRESFPP